MCDCNRRRFVVRCAATGLALSPLAALLAACGGPAGWPEGMTEIKWDRDVCVRCSMVISDRRFAAQLRGGARDTVFKFDDVGCLVFWLRDKLAEHPWMADAATRMWVADAASRADAVKWLDPRKAHYIGKSSPMGYNFGAVSAPLAGSMDFAQMRAHVLAKGK